jgi:hypothetical protein
MRLFIAGAAGLLVLFAGPALAHSKTSLSSWKGRLSTSRYSRTITSSFNDELESMSIGGMPIPRDSWPIVADHQFEAC